MHRPADGQQPKGEQHQALAYNARCLRTSHPHGHPPTKGPSASILKDLLLGTACGGSFPYGGSPPSGPGSSTSATVLGNSVKH